ncbi:carboxypeptidase-like regulatory domain-containing protein [Thermoleptolyngbya sp.]
MAQLMKVFRSRRFLLISVGISLAIAMASLLMPNLWQSAKGHSTLYGKIADTRSWIDGVGQHQPGLLQHARVTINSIPPQTTYTDDQGQFWFEGLRDISYTLKVEVPYDKVAYHLVKRVEGMTGAFFDLVQDEAHNLHEIDY